MFAKSDRAFTLAIILFIFFSSYQVCCQSISNSLNASKLFKPKIITASLNEPKNVVKPSGRAVRFNCSFSGNPAPQVTWFKGSKKMTFRPNGDHFTVSNNSLYMENLSPIDAADYTCVGRNSEGKGSFTYHLEVMINDVFPPRIDKTLLKNLVVNPGESVSVLCDYESTYATLVRWFKEVNGSLIPINATQEDSHYLKIPHVTNQHTGIYTCTASNIYGLSKESIRIDVRDQPVMQEIYESQRKKTSYIIVGLAISLLIVILIGLMKIYRLKKKRVVTIRAQTSFIIRKKITVEHPDNGKSLSPFVKIECEKISGLDLQHEDMKRTLNEYHFPLDPAWEVPRDRIKLGPCIGEGAFGVVHEATAFGINGKDDSTQVALKMLKNGHSDNDVKDLVSEMEVMKKVGRHNNIISLLGCVTQDGMCFKMCFRTLLALSTLTASLFFLSTIR